MAFSVSACLNQPASSLLPESFSVSKSLPETETKSPISIHPDNSKYAFCNEGLYIYNFQNGSKDKIHGQSPKNLAWSMDGSYLAAGFLQDNGSRLIIFSPAGELINSSDFEGYISAISWTAANQILLGSVARQEFTFGTELTYLLHRWDMEHTPITMNLGTSVAKKSTIKLLKNNYPDTMQIALSPNGIEIVYSKLVEPPLLKHSLDFYHRNLTTNTEHFQTRSSIFSRGVFITNSGEDIILSDGNSGTTSSSMLTDKQNYFWPENGIISGSPAGNFISIGGTIYNGPKKIAVFSKDSEIFFAPMGIFFLVRQNKTLFRINGLG